MDWIGKQTLDQARSCMGGGKVGQCPPNEKTEMNKPHAGLVIWELKLRFVEDELVNVQTDQGPGKSLLYQPVKSEPGFIAAT